MRLLNGLPLEEYRELDRWDIPAAMGLSEMFTSQRQQGESPRSSGRSSGRFKRKQPVVTGSARGRGREGCFGVLWKRERSRNQKGGTCMLRNKKFAKYAVAFNILGIVFNFMYSGLQNDHINIIQGFFRLDQRLHP